MALAWLSSSAVWLLRRSQMRAHLVTSTFGSTHENYLGHLLKEQFGKDRDEKGNVGEGSNADERELLARRQSLASVGHANNGVTLECLGLLLRHCCVAVSGGSDQRVNEGRNLTAIAEPCFDLPHVQQPFNTSQTICTMNGGYLTRSCHQRKLVALEDWNSGGLLGRAVRDEQTHSVVG